MRTTSQTISPNGKRRALQEFAERLAKSGKMSKKELEKFDADKEAKKEWERIVRCDRCGNIIENPQPDMISIYKHRV